MTKAEIRKKYKAKRQAFAATDIETSSLALANNALSAPIWDYQTYHIFLSIEAQKEVQTDYLLHILQGMDKNVVVSRSDFTTGDMSHYLLTDQTRLIFNAYGIPEPDLQAIPIQTSAIEVVFVPLLVCDIKGNRIGYGKGFYDRFLNQCSATTKKIGLSLFNPIPEIIDKEAHDVALDMLLTDNSIFHFV
ncbi:5-formyltetrahydrofolate cyclo-ligase [Nonlabens xiamenensis]|uniref:5-formyltetrahydrofolate cyclo-ligase n=1 Tax=Nonlabens xiamenensis TaxID=2341043 RepID=UPI000F614C98|nr:5-formyltetrahydrofolate cyclo-ligase [Nonlabens xiamenensis]